MQNKNNTRQNSKLITVINEKSLAVAVIFLFALHIIFSLSLSRFYGMEGMDILIKLTTVIIFELGFFITYINKKLLSSIAYSFIALLVMIIVSNFFFQLFFTLYAFPKLFTYVVMVLLLGVAVGFLVEKIVKIQLNYFIPVGLVVVVFANFVALKLFEPQVINCENRRDQIEIDFCYANMAERNKDIQLCAKIKDTEDRRICYDDVIFGYEKGKYKSTDKCEVISDKNDREYCYAKVEMARCSEFEMGKERGDCIRAVRAKYPEQGNFIQ